MELLERLAANAVDVNLHPPSVVGLHELALALNTTRVRLDLWNGELGAADVHELAVTLDRNTTLVELSLGHNNIGEDGARHLAAALERNRTLVTLNCTSEPVTWPQCWNETTG
jgi:hypothetical protein